MGPISQNHIVLVCITHHKNISKKHISQRAVSQPKQLRKIHVIGVSTSNPSNSSSFFSQFQFKPVIGIAPVTQANNFYLPKINILKTSNWSIAQRQVSCPQIHVQQAISMTTCNFLIYRVNFVIQARFNLICV